MLLMWLGEVPVPTTSAEERACQMQRSRRVVVFSPSHTVRRKKSVWQTAQGTSREG